MAEDLRNTSCSAAALFVSTDDALRKRQKASSSMKAALPAEAPWAERVDVDALSTKAAEFSRQLHPSG